MSGYKQPCIHCGTYVESDASFCPKCGSRSPFGYVCPTCRASISKEDKFCSGCGRELYIKCPHCGGQTFVQDTCQVCGKSLMKKCPNRRCGEEQFFENKKCTACGKLL